MPNGCRRPVEKVRFPSGHQHDNALPNGCWRLVEEVRIPFGSLFCPSVEKLKNCLEGRHFHLEEGQHL